LCARSAANLNALEDAGFGFIVGSRITRAPYDLAEHFQRHGNYFTDGQVLEPARQMRTGKAARDRRVACQWKFKREQHDNKAINAMIERAEKIADGRARLKARFGKVTDATTELDRPRPGPAAVSRRWRRTARAGPASRRFRSRQPGCPSPPPGPGRCRAAARPKRRSAALRRRPR
jgi:hypothetical protein